MLHNGKILVLARRLGCYEMNLLSPFRYPAYLYNPKQLLTRLGRQFGRAKGSSVVRLPWGHPLEVSTTEFIGRAIWTQGIHELNVCEAIARLVHEGDTVVDVGANVGFVTSLMAKTVGATGRVVAFEPHPGLYRRLCENIARFTADDSGRVTSKAVALCDCEGDDWLVFDSEKFSRNSGTAGLQAASFAVGSERLRVQAGKLDSFINDEVVALLKIDVEGAELRVLRGAEKALAERRIRTVVYEDFSYETSGIASYLRKYGFSVFYLDGSLVRPCLRYVDEGFQRVPRRRDENFVAVLDAPALMKAYRRLGWRVFRL
jgi:FkbM family methyltransferase